MRSVVQSNVFQCVATAKRLSVIIESLVVAYNVSRRRLVDLLGRGGIALIDKVEFPKVHGCFRILKTSPVTTKLGRIVVVATFVAAVITECCNFVTRLAKRIVKGAAFGTIVTVEALAILFASHRFLVRIVWL